MCNSGSVPPVSIAREYFTPLQTWIVFAIYKSAANSNGIVNQKSVCLLMFTTNKMNKIKTTKSSSPVKPCEKIGVH